MLVASDFGFDSIILEALCSLKNYILLAVFDEAVGSTYLEQSPFVFQMESLKVKGEQVQ